LTCCLHRRERLADQLFVRERAIDLCGVEEGYPAFDRPADEIDSLLLVEGVAIIFWGERVARPSLSRPGANEHAFLESRRLHVADRVAQKVHHDCGDLFMLV
jgi:hypothetical protein